jgi:PAS domain S-box-containing protein
MELLQLIISKIPAHVFLKDASGRFIACSDLLAQDAGLDSSEDVLGKTDFDMPWAPYAKKYAQDDALIISLKEPRIEAEEYYTNKQGQKAIIKITKMPIPLSDGSVAILGFHIGIDKKNEPATALLEDIINYIPHHIFWKDKNGVFVGCNKHFAAAAGFEHPWDLIGKTDKDMPWHEQAQKYREDDMAVMRAGLPQVDIEDTQTRIDGTVITALVSKVPLFDTKKRIAGVLGIYSDITDRKKREVELAHQKKLAEVASRAKSEFISNISHDIRTPISGMLGLIHSIKARVQDKEIQEDADLLMASTNKLLDLLNEVLDVVQIESSKAKAREEIFNLYELIQNNFMLLRPAIKNQGIALNYNFPSEIPHYFTGNRLLINRIFMNLLGNAVKFTNSGEIFLSVIPVKNEEHLIWLDIVVKDTGIGIPEDKFEEIFDHFSRLTPAYQGIYQGSGMGLYTVKRYLEELGGKIRVESEVGKGSTFTVSLPIKKVSAKDIAIFQQQEIENKNLIEVLSESPRSMSAKKQVKVLIVEDQILALRMARRLLEELNCEVESATNGREALESIKNNDYDLIFMDIGLPDGDGTAICNKIRALPDSKKANTPIIGLTAHLDARIENSCRQVGMQDVMTKPLTSVSAQNILEKYLTS